MGFDTVFQELKKSYGLKGQHIDILSCLQHTDLSAEEISRQTKISLGRLYSFLNALSGWGLIERQGRKPFVYSMQPPQERILHFMKHHFDEQVQKQSKIMDLLEEKDRVQDLEIIESSEKFSYNMMRLLSEAKHFNSIARHTSFPFSLYTHSKKDFIALRDVITQTRETLAYHTKEMSSIMFNTLNDYHRRQRPFCEIVCKEALDTHLALIRAEFGNDLYERIVEGIRNKIVNQNFTAYVFPDYTPMQIFITDKKVLFSLIHKGKTTGVIIKSSQVINLYEQMFSTMLARSVPIQEYLKIKMD